MLELTIPDRSHIALAGNFAIFTDNFQRFADNSDIYGKRAHGSTGNFHNITSDYLLKNDCFDNN